MISTVLEGFEGAAVIDCYLFDFGKRLACLFSNGTVRLYDTCSRNWYDLPSSSSQLPDANKTQRRCVKSLTLGGAANRYVLGTVTESGHLHVYALNANGLSVDLLFEQPACFPTNCSYTVTSSAFNNNATLLVIALELRNQSASKKSDDDDDEDEAKLLFYDIRRGVAQPLGCYKDSHSDAINTVKFADFCDDYLLSGGADGLVNVYDLKQSNEDDALLYSFNCESSVSRTNFYGNSFQDSNVYAVTDDNNLFGWNVVEGDEIISMKSVALNNCTFLVDCFSPKMDYSLFPVFSDSDGLLTVGRLVCRNPTKSGSSNVCDLISMGSCKEHESLIRCCSWNEDLQLLATGADDGTVVLSKLFCANQQVSDQIPKNNKSTSKKSRSHPYNS